MKKKGPRLSERQIYLRTFDYELNYCMTTQTRWGIEYRLSKIFNDGNVSEWDPTYKVCIEKRDFPIRSVSHYKWCITVYENTVYGKHVTDIIPLKSKWYFNAVKETLTWVKKHRSWEYF